MGDATGYLVGYIVKMPDLEHFGEKHGIVKTKSESEKIVRINQWVSTHKIQPPLPLLCCAILESGDAAGLVLTKHLCVLPESGDVEETEHDQELKRRFATAGDLEAQSSSWKFTTIRNY